MRLVPRISFDGDAEAAVPDVAAELAVVEMTAEAAAVARADREVDGMAAVAAAAAKRQMKAGANTRLLLSST